MTPVQRWTYQIGFTVAQVCFLVICVKLAGDGRMIWAFVAGVASLTISYAHGFLAGILDSD